MESLACSDVFASHSFALLGDQRMNLTSVARRAARVDLQYVLGRFRTVRASYSGLRRAYEAATRIDNIPGQHPTLFPDVDVARVVQSIRDEAVSLGLNLPDRIVSEIRHFGMSEP